MKLASFSTVITPAVGTTLAGYGPNDVSEAVHDDLTLQGFCLDDGSKKVLLLSYDLLGMDHAVVARIRQGCASLLGIVPADVLVSCTHTHGGPHTRSLSGKGRELNEDYCNFMTEKTFQTITELKEKEFEEVTVSFYSGRCFANTNRRYCGPENVCRYLPDNRSLEPLGDGIADPETGLLVFWGADKRPREIVVNYAAHPLVSHAEGRAGHTITADYPALVREITTAQTGAHCTFITGAAGDQFPRDSELGFPYLDSIAKPLCREIIKGVEDAKRNPEKFLLKDPKLQTLIKSFPCRKRTSVPPEKQLPATVGKEEVDAELQFLTIGDICFVGVPFELVGEIGLEIKWHSPFRKTFICYNSTDYLDYCCHVNALVAGGYEAFEQKFEPLAGLKLLNTAVEGMFELAGNKRISQLD